jgi:hypothetical protein
MACSISFELLKWFHYGPEKSQKLLSSLLLYRSYYQSWILAWT